MARGGLRAQLVVPHRLEHHTHVHEMRLTCLGEIIITAYLHKPQTRPRRCARRNPSLVEQGDHLLAALVEFAQRPALHYPRARHRMRPRLDAQLQVEHWATVQRQAWRRVREHVGILGWVAVHWQRTRWSVGGERDVADEQRRAVGECRAGVGKARPASVSSARAAVATAASAATVERHPVVGDRGTDG